MAGVVGPPWSTRLRTGGGRAGVAWPVVVRGRMVAIEGSQGRVAWPVVARGRTGAIDWEARRGTWVVVVRRRAAAIDGGWECVGGQGCAGARLPSMRVSRSLRHCSVCWTWLNVKRCSPATPAAGAVTAGPSLASRRSGR